ncbi:MAG: LemA family protein [Opitutaceae bacterium]|jgi:hypothetical protein
MIDAPPFVPIACSLVVPVAACLWASLRLRRKQRLLHDLPTSKVRGAFIGLVELKGSVESESPFTSYLAETACALYNWRVEERWSRTVTETYTDSKGRTQTRTRHESGWRNVAEGGEAAPFYLQDDTGALLVRPAGAKIEPRTLFSKQVSRGDPLYYGKGPDTSVSNSDHVRRFVETGLPLHAPVFVVGPARERADMVAPEIAAQRDAPEFLISTRAEEKIQSGLSGWSWFWWIAGLLVASGPLIFLVASAQKQTFPSSYPGYASLFPIGYLAATGTGWIWMAYNSLVSLRQRVRQGWSLIDVQLKRRHDLLPALATTVGALSDHESNVQKTVAALRAQATATPPGVSGPDFEGLSAQLRVVIERYPQLTAQPAFAALHRQLVETEQRIALARTYYNDIATHYATRLEIIPDRWVAGLGAMKPEPLLAAASFERAPVPVSFAR